MKCLLFIMILFTINAQEKITFNSLDDLQITADVYIKHPKSASLIILFHQAGWSRGEYLEIAPKLNKLGFNCIAIDQRSGKEVNGVKNQTYLAAKKRSLDTNYLDAYQDMKASVSFVKENLTTGNVIVWGSSYSSALVLRLASEINVDGVLSFAPGEYFNTKDYIKNFAKNIDAPVFMTSAKNEELNWKFIFEAIPSKGKVSFLPKTTGNHGSRALWDKFSDSKDYWVEVTLFLNNLL